jgi:hypothetical protein
MVDSTSQKANRSSAFSEWFSPSRRPRVYSTIAFTFARISVRVEHSSCLLLKGDREVQLPSGQMANAKPTKSIRERRRDAGAIKPATLRTDPMS